MSNADIKEGKQKHLVIAGKGETMWSHYRSHCDDSWKCYIIYLSYS